MATRKMQGMNVEVIHGHDWRLHEIGEAFGLSRERIRQIECAAIEHIKAKTRRCDCYLEEFIEPDSHGALYGGDPVVHTSVPLQPHERLGWGISFWDTASEARVAVALARRACQMEQLGLSIWDEVPREILWHSGPQSKDEEDRVVEQIMQSGKVSIPENKQKFLDTIGITEEELRASTECVMWPGKPHRDGWGTFTFIGVGRALFTHRVAFGFFVESPRQRVIRLSCGNRLCVNPNHMVVGEARTRASKLEQLVFPYDPPRQPLPSDGATAWDRFLTHLEANRERFLARLDMTEQDFVAGDACVPWPSRARDGGKFSSALHFDALNPHRVSYRLFCGDLTLDQNVLRSCDTPNCVRPSHLTTVDRAEFLSQIRRGGVDQMTDVSHSVPTESDGVRLSDPPADGTPEPVQVPENVASTPSTEDDTPVEDEYQETETQQAELLPTECLYVSCEHVGFYSVNFWIDEIPLIHSGDYHEYVTAVSGDIIWAHEDAEQAIGRLEALLVMTSAYSIEVLRDRAFYTEQERMKGLLDVVFRDPAKTAAVYRKIQWCHDQDLLVIKKIGVESEFRGRGAASAAVRQLYKTFGGRSARMLVHARPGIYADGVFAWLPLAEQTLEHKAWLRTFLLRLGFRSLPDTPSVLTADAGASLEPRQLTRLDVRSAVGPQGVHVRPDDVVAIGRKPQQTHIVDFVSDGNVVFLCGRSRRATEVHHADPFGIRRCDLCAKRRDQIWKHARPGAMR